MRNTLKDIVVAKSDNGDWVGIYVDGTLVTENHSLSPAQILNAIGVSYRNATISGERMEEMGRFPKSYEEFEEILDDEMNCNLDR